MNKSIINIKFTNGDNYKFKGVVSILIDELNDAEKDYLPISKNMYVMKKNILYIEILESEEEK